MSITSAGGNSSGKSSTRPLQIFVSSTFDDLKEHRAAVIEAIDRMEHDSVRMEAFGSRPKDSVEYCAQQAASADALVVLVAHRYGWVPEDETPSEDETPAADGSKSITWIEVEAARSAGKPVYAYLVDEAHEWSGPTEEQGLKSATTQKAALEVFRRVKDLAAFKKELSRQLRTSFTTPDDLAKKVTWDLPNVVKEHFERLQAVQDPPAEPSDDSHLAGALAVARRKYIDLVYDQNALVALRGMGAKRAERLPLDAVYTELRLEGGESVGDGSDETLAARRKLGQRALSGDGDPERDNTLPAALRKHRKLVLIGDPGSGKTTYLRYVAVCLARAHCGQEGELERIGLDRAATLPQTLPQTLQETERPQAPELPLPVLLAMSEFGSFLQAAEACGAPDAIDATLPKDSVEHFWAFLSAHQVGSSCGLPAGYLRTEVENGCAFLLIDGLDEVPGEQTRERVARILENLLLHAGDSRVLVTCRTRAFEGNTQLVSEQAGSRKLAKFNDQQVQRFVELWCAALYTALRRDGRSEESEGGEQAGRSTEFAYRERLLLALHSHPSARQFMESPLMLTMLAVVHWAHKELPELRADLYEAAVQYLLTQRLELSLETLDNRLQVMMELALAMAEDGLGFQRRWDREPALAQVAATLAKSEPDASAFLDDEELHSGLLVSRTTGTVEFWHLSFQEYLAGRALCDVPEEERWKRIAGHLHEDRWEEPILLFAGRLRHFGRSTVQRFVRQVVEHRAPNGAADSRAIDVAAHAVTHDATEQARSVAFAGKILRDLAPDGFVAEAATGYHDALEVARQFLRPGAPSLDEATRRSLGAALGALPEGDPRLADPAANRVSIDGGVFTIGAQSEDENAAHYDAEAHSEETPTAVRLSPFAIGRFPVTVHEYGQFLEVGGYQLEQPEMRAHWGAAGALWLERTVDSADQDSPNPRQPQAWAAQRKTPNRPVTGVSWYEATAYSSWVGGQLPSEAQWEFAARGPSGRRYPWGPQEPDHQRANFDNALGPSAVGCYPGGVTPNTDLYDLAGNVLEWCCDAWDGRAYSKWFGSPPLDPCTEGSKDSSRALRGGAGPYPSSYLRAASRLNRDPEYRGIYVGFRVVWLSP